MGLFKGKSEEELFSSDTIIEHGMVVDASILTGSCGLVVRGIVKANIDIDADLFIDSSGTVEGDVICSNCTINGKIAGNISASGAIKISADGSVFGDISCSSLNVCQGGNFRGTCNKMKQQVKINLFEIEKIDVEKFEKMEKLEKAEKLEKIDKMGKFEKTEYENEQIEADMPIIRRTSGDY